MAEMDAEPQDPRHLLIGTIIRNKEYYKTRRSRRIGKKLHHWIKEGRSPDEENAGRPYSVVVDCCALSINVQNEIITNYYAPVRRHFRRFFPELDSLVADPVGYLRVVKKIVIGMEARNAIFSDGLLLELQQEGLLSPSAVTTVAALRSSLSTRPKQLGRETLIKIERACKIGLNFDIMRRRLDAFVHSGGRIAALAPNLSALVGTAVAAKLIGAAGGLSELSAMPISAILFLSAVNCRKDPHDDETLVTSDSGLDCPPQEQQQLPVGIIGCYVGETDIIQGTPQLRLQTKACHGLAEGIKLAATIDLDRTDPTGEKGMAMGDEIRVMIEKWKEEDSAMLMKLRTELAERPKKDKLAVSKGNSKMFKPSLNKEKHHHIPRRVLVRKARRAERAERVFASLKDLGLTTTTTKATSLSDLQAH